MAGSPMAVILGLLAGAGQRVVGRETDDHPEELRLSVWIMP
jgi:hypothetical protein